MLACAAGLAQAPQVEQARTLDSGGVALAEGGNLNSAIVQFRQALLLAPDLAEVHFHLGMAYDLTARTDEAMEELEATLRLRADFLQARYLLAGCCRKRGDFPGELRLLAGIVHAAPEFAEARYNYGLALQRNGKSVEA